MRCALQTDNSSRSHQSSHHRHERPTADIVQVLNPTVGRRLAAFNVGVLLLDRRFIPVRRPWTRRVRSNIALRHSHTKHPLPCRRRRLHLTTIFATTTTSLLPTDSAPPAARVATPAACRRTIRVESQPSRAAETWLRAYAPIKSCSRRDPSPPTASSGPHHQHHDVCRRRLQIVRETDDESGRRLRLPMYSDLLDMKSGDP